MIQREKYGSTYWINTTVFTTLDFPQTSGIQKLMMSYPAQFRRQDELTIGGNSMEEARGNGFIFVVHFLSAICYWIVLYKLEWRAITYAWYL